MGSKGQFLGKCSSAIRIFTICLEFFLDSYGQMGAEANQ